MICCANPGLTQTLRIMHNFVSHCETVNKLQTLRTEEYLKD